MDLNPYPIQEGYDDKDAESHASTEPLFLIHDGGGTVFNYFLLDTLDRDLWGISDPHWGTESTWDNIEGMAVEYVQLIKSAVPTGDIILGGWSLGGLVSVQIAHLLANDDSGLRVVGVVMIDSFYPLRGERKRIIRSRKGGMTSAETMEKIKKRMDEARRMINQWTGPTWRGPRRTASTITAAAAAAVDVTPSGVPQSGDKRPPPSPPTILIRATEEDFDASLAAAGGVSIHDPIMFRSGFDQYSSLDLVDIVPCTGDHFSIFDDQNVGELSQKIKEACTRLSRL